MVVVVVVVDLRRGRLPLDEDLTWRHSHPSSATAAADQTTWRGKFPGPAAAHTYLIVDTQGLLGSAVRRL